MIDRAASPNPFRQLVTVQLSDDVTVSPGDVITVEVHVGNPPNARESMMHVFLNGSRIPAAFSFDFRSR